MPKMKKIFAVVLAGVMLFGFTACSRFGPHDNPPMLVPVLIQGSSAS